MSYSATEFVEEVMQDLLDRKLVAREEVNAATDEEDTRELACLALVTISNLVDAVDALRDIMRCARFHGPAGVKALAVGAKRIETAQEVLDRLNPYRAADPADDSYPPPCSHPGGHEWNRTAGEADEARLAGDYANDNIRCIYCGADGDA